MVDSVRASEASKSARGPIVLVVEDEILVRSTVAEDLREFGFTVVEAANSLEAVAVLSSGDAVDAVFTDINMPGTMDGIDLSRWIRRHHPRVCVLLTSGAAGHITSRFLGEPFFPKPYDPANVAERIRFLLAQTRDQIPGDL